MQLNTIVCFSILPIHVKITFFTLLYPTWIFIASRRIFSILTDQEPCPVPKYREQYLRLKNVRNLNREL